MAAQQRLYADRTVRTPLCGLSESLGYRTSLFTTQQPCTISATCWRHRKADVGSVPFVSNANSWENRITLAFIINALIWSPSVIVLSSVIDRTLLGNGGFCVSSSSTFVTSFSRYCFGATWNSLTSFPCCATRRRRSRSDAGSTVWWCTTWTHGSSSSFLVTCLYDVLLSLSSSFRANLQKIWTQQWSLVLKVSQNSSDIV